MQAPVPPPASGSQVLRPKQDGPPHWALPVQPHVPPPSIGWQAFPMSQVAPQLVHHPKSCAGLPQLPFIVPVWHIPPVLQHPPLQVSPNAGLHVVPQTPALQACPTGQSVGATQAVHLPPEAHTPPSQLMQVPPSAPHAIVSVPVTQLVPVQHPPLH